MRLARRTALTAALAVSLAAASLTAALATSASGSTPKIAFLANGRVPADALAAGPIAGQLGAPIYTTEQGTLSPEAASALTAYQPELVIVLGGSVAIDDAVVDQVEEATGLTEAAAGTAPASGVVRAAGENRFATATAVAGLLAQYDPAFVSATGGVDADTLAGRSADEFLTTTDAIDADTVDGMDSSAFVTTGQQCASGQYVEGMDASGALACAQDSADGGDAETVDGQDATDFVQADSRMLPVVVFNYDDNGWINTEHHRSPVTGSPTVTNPTTGRYDVTIPGVDFHFAYDVATCNAMSSSSPVFLTLSSGFDGELIVFAHDETGAGVDGISFTCSVYDMD